MFAQWNPFQLGPRNSAGPHVAATIANLNFCDLLSLSKALYPQEPQRKPAELIRPLSSCRPGTLCCHHYALASKSSGGCLHPMGTSLLCTQGLELPQHRYHPWFHGFTPAMITLGRRRDIATSKPGKPPPGGGCGTGAPDLHRQRTAGRTPPSRVGS